MRALHRTHCCQLSPMIFSSLPGRSCAPHGIGKETKSPSAELPACSTGMLRAPDTVGAVARAHTHQESAPAAALGGPNSSAEVGGAGFGTPW